MKKFSIEFKWAAIATLAALIWMFLEKYLGYHDEKITYQIGFSLLFSIPLIVIYYLALKEKKKEFYNNIVSWRQIFFTGLVLCIMISVFFPIVQYITYMQVSPNFVNHLIDEIVAHNRMSLEDAQANISFDIFLRQGVSSNLSTGVVVSAILAYFLQTKEGEITDTKTTKPIKTKHKGKKKVK